MRARNVFAVVLICLAAGCVGYNGAIERQLAKEHAAIEAQIATNEVPQ